MAARRRQKRWLPSAAGPELSSPASPATPPPAPSEHRLGWGRSTREREGERRREEREEGEEEREEEKEEEEEGMEGERREKREWYSMLSLLPSILWKGCTSYMYICMFGNTSSPSSSMNVEWLGALLIL